MDNSVGTTHESVDDHWDVEISSKHKILDLHLREVIKYRDLILLFVKRDFTVSYKQTVLGPLWYLVQPIMSTVMHAFVFGGLAKLGTDGIPFALFYYSGTMLWTLFTGSLGTASNTFLSNSNVFSKVYFPRLVAPISGILGQYIKLAVQFVLLLIFYVYYIIQGSVGLPSPMFLLFPLLILWISAMAFGYGIMISSLTTKYRDLKIVIDYGIGLAMYVTPVVYPLSQAPEKYKWVFYLNPLSAPIELFRKCFFGAGNVPISMIMSSLGISLVGLLIGLILFNRNERTFVDVI